MSAAEIIQELSIGASEIAAIAGISPWADRWTVYARKHKLIEPEPPSEEMYWGIKLERIIAEVFGERTSLPVEWSNQKIWSRALPWQHATPDAYVIGLDGERAGVLEIKTAGLHQAGEWDRDATGEDGVPDYYVSQVQWQLTVTGLAFGYIAVLIAGNDFRIYRIEDDPVLAGILNLEGEEFYFQHLLPGVEPPIGGSELARQYLRRRFPRQREQLRPATAAEAELLDHYAELRGLLKQGAKRRKQMENQITQAIADAEGLTWERGKLTWKRTKDSHPVNWEALAKSQITHHSVEEQKELIRQYTGTKLGYRKIYFAGDDDEE